VPKAPTDASILEIEAATKRKSALLDEIDRATGGRRSPAGQILDQAEIERLTREFEELGGDPEMLKFNHGRRTAFFDGNNTINVRGDINPAEGATLPRERMSSKSALGHELGHAHYRGTRLKPGAWNDEFRASYWAADNLEGLSLEERAELMADAQSRAADAGVTIKLNARMKELLYGIPPR
jgi:hypothetical protein